MRLVGAIFLIIFALNAQAQSRLPSKTLIFFVDQIPDSGIENIIKTSGEIFTDHGDGSYTVKVPIKNENGAYELVEVHYVESDGARTISIPGHGELSVIKDDDGGFSFQVTPEQIKDAENVTCSVKSGGSGTCTIEPFITMVGDKILSADRLVVNYQDGENLTVAGGEATNLQLTEPGSTTEFNRSQTNAGDATVSLAFSDPTPKQSNYTTTIFGQTITLPVARSPSLSEVENAKNIEFTVKTTQLVHTVSNPSNPSQSAVKFQVNENAGIESTVKIDRSEHLRINANVATGAGVYYNSNPFDTNGVVISSSSVVNSSVAVDNDPANPRASVNFQIAGVDSNGLTSHINIVERKDGKTTTLDSYGETYINLSQATLVDEKTLKPLDSDAPVVFEVGSNYLRVVEQNDKGLVTTELTGLVASGEIGKDQKNVNLSASTGRYQTSKEQAGTQSLVAVMNENIEEKRVMGMMDHAYYRNDSSNVSLSNGVFLDVREYKNNEKAPTFDGKTIKQDGLMIGQTMNVASNGVTSEFSGGVGGRHLVFTDNSSVTAISGGNGTFRGSDYQVGLSSGYELIAKRDSSGNIQTAQISSGEIAGEQKNNSLRIINSQTSFDQTKKNDQGKAILEIQHRSDGAHFLMNGQEKEITTKNAQMNAVKDDQVLFASATFDEIKAKDSSGSDVRDIRILGVEAVMFHDKAQDVKTGELKAQQFDFEQADYKVNVSALDNQGQNKKFQIFFFENGTTKNYRIFAEDGNLVRINTNNRNDRDISALLKSIDYLESNGFRQFSAESLAASVREVKGSDERINSFNLQYISGVESLDGNYRYMTLNNGQFAHISASAQHQLGVESAQYQQTRTNDGESTIFDGRNLVIQSNDVNGRHLHSTFDSLQGAKVQSGSSTNQVLMLNNGNGAITDANKKIDFSNFNLAAVQEQTSSGTIRYGNLKFESLNAQTQTGGKVTDVKILGAEVLAYSDDTNKSSFLEGSFDKIQARNADYSVDILAKNSQGVEEKFKVIIVREGEQEQAKIFSSDGSLVAIDASDSKQKAGVLFQTAEYLKTDQFKAVMVENLSGSLETIDPSDKRTANFAIGHLEQFKSHDGTMESARLSDASLGVRDQKSQAHVHFRDVAYRKELSTSGELTNVRVLDTTLNYIQFKDPVSGQSESKSLEANVSIGEAIYSELKTSEGKVTSLRANNIELVAVDYEAMMEFQGKIGSVEQYKDSMVDMVSAKDLTDFNITDNKNNIAAQINAGKIVRVISRDENGKEVGSYLLVNKATLQAQDKESGISANIRAGVLEFYQDRVNKRNIIINADIDGKIALDKTKSPVAAEVNFALKGHNLTTESKSTVSQDGNTVESYFAIKVIDSTGGLEHLKLEAGPSFLKDAISISAKDSKGDGKSLSFTFQQDKENGTYYVLAEFIEGDKVKVKLFPFTLESKMEGADAVAELLLTPKGQNYLNHMQIISNVVSAHEITSWLGVSDGGMLIARTGTHGGFGFEMMYQDQEKFNPNPDMTIGGNTDIAKSYGLGVYHENKKGDRSSVGVLLSGDSEIEYQTNGRGVLKIFGQDMNQTGSIPATINLYFKKDYRDGDSLYAGVFVDAASMMVDEQRLSRSSAFYDGGRSSGKTGATLAYSKKINDNSRLTLALGANNNFSDPAICVTYSLRFGGGTTSRSTSALTRDTMKIVNRLNEESVFNERRPSSIGPTLESAIIDARNSIQKLKIKNEEAQTMIKAKLVLENTLSALERGELTAGNVARVFNLKEDDLNKIRAYENRMRIGNGLSTKLEGIVDLVRYDFNGNRSSKALSQRKEQLLSLAEELTRKFDQEESLKTFNEYTQAVEELNSLVKSP